jgi:hypothetical protein
MRIVAAIASQMTFSCAVGDKDVLKLKKSTGSNIAGFKVESNQITDVRIMRPTPVGPPTTNASVQL